MNPGIFLPLFSGYVLGVIWLAQESDTVELGKRLASRLRAGDLVLLDGQLGAGKTTLVRGILAGLGWNGAVRSPSFSVMVPYSTEPPALHVDLYRLQGEIGLDLVEELQGRIGLIEWPGPSPEWNEVGRVWRVRFEWRGEGRMVSVDVPEGEVAFEA